ncbi:MAG: epoxyqueuosine reductase QueH [Lachnospiraceae bacterium]|nr:epoxyqueuosine reductase QueH [Lachnospiraceae bacterium]
MNQRNYQKEMETIIERNKEDGRVPTLLLHSCCAPCSSYVLEYLSEYFYITVFYYNPNIYPDEEYKKRVIEQQEFIRKFPMKYPVKFIEGDFEKDLFYEKTKGKEQIKEGGERCFLCYELRLEKTAKLAKELSFDYFTTTLSISPLKNAAKLNEIGQRLGKTYNIPYLVSDFKKKNGYKRSVEISKEYEMYRQYYCGCVYSKKQRDEEIAAKEENN